MSAKYMFAGGDGSSGKGMEGKIAAIRFSRPPSPIWQRNASPSSPCSPVQRLYRRGKKGNVTKRMV